MDLKAALNFLHSGQTLSITFITADVERGSGGKIIHLPRARIARRKPINEFRKSATEKQTEIVRKDPRHNYHFTRNLELPDKTLRKVHPLLILNINSIDII